MKIFDQLKQLQNMGQTQGANPFENYGDSFTKNEPFSKKLEGISPVAKEAEPTYELGDDFSMELDNNSYGSTSQDDQSKKKEQMMAQLGL